MASNAATNGTVVYRFDGSAVDRLVPGVGEPLVWEIPMQDGSQRKLRSGDTLPEGTDEDFPFLVPHETICPDKATWTISCWGELRDIMSVQDAMPRAINERYREELKERLAKYDYTGIFIRHFKTDNKEWGKVMRELLTMHALERNLSGKPIPIIKDLPRSEQVSPRNGRCFETPCLFIPATKPVFGPPLPPNMAARS